ncbi:hypothetical protein QYM36_017918, partial [Artemia franciscana]
MALPFAWNETKDKISFETLLSITGLTDADLWNTLWSIVGLPKRKQQVLLYSPTCQSQEDFTYSSNFRINENFAPIRNGKVQKFGKVNLIGRSRLVTEEQKDELDKAIMKQRATIVQVFDQELDALEVETVEKETIHPQKKEQEKKISSLTTVLGIAKSIPEYAGTSDVDEFIESLEIFNELAQPYDFKTKKQCLATRLRGSALQYFDSVRDMETVYDYKQIKDMETQGVIKEAVSEWCFPLVIVRKKDNTWRCCVDFRALNAVTVKDVMKFPRIDSILDSLGGSNFYTSFDLIAGYWQIALDPESKHKATVILDD